MSEQTIRYKCKKCEQQFELERIPERAGCPYCGSDNFRRYYDD